MPRRAAIDMIRVPRDDEFERLREIERVAGELFADFGMAEVAAHQPFSVDELRHFKQAGQRLGFRRLTALTKGLQEIRQREAGIGLDRWPRMAMRRESVAA